MLYSPHSSSSRPWHLRPLWREAIGGHAKPQDAAGGLWQATGSRMRRRPPRPRAPGSEGPLGSVWKTLGCQSHLSHLARHTPMASDRAGSHMRARARVVTVSDWRGAHRRRQVLTSSPQVLTRTLSCSTIRRAVAIPGARQAAVRRRSHVPALSEAQRRPHGLPGRRSKARGGARRHVRALPTSWGSLQALRGADGHRQAATSDRTDWVERPMALPGAHRRAGAHCPRRPLTSRPQLARGTRRGRPPQQNPRESARIRENLRESATTPWRKRKRIHENPRESARICENPQRTLMETQANPREPARICENLRTMSWELRQGRRGDPARAPAACRA